MPVRFARLRIAGFKSFAEPASLDILPGLTGVVGPNGCGKSNVVEALRWAMGEASARALRGGEMDDVIFAGTAHRPSRNLAEVTLSLEETAGAAPPPFDTEAELQITRRIERGAGSQFRINGREVRARDVQTLFADLASGARASAMVSQGRVGAIVAAKPEERRSLLEEAAGITGLHARRHEAEGKLRAAETNLERAEDLRGQLDAQMAELQRQARQAARYRGLSGTIRTAEAEWLAIQLGRAEAGRRAAATALATAEHAATQAADSAREAREAACALAATMPPRRAAEAQARTALERHRLAAEQIAADEARAREALAAARQRLAQLGRDLAHAHQAQRDAAAAAERLAGEDARLIAAEAGHPECEAAAESETLAAADAARLAEAEANRATEQTGALAARGQALAQLLAQAEARHRRAADQLARLAQEHRRVAAQTVDPARLEAAAAEQAQAEATLGQARAALEAAEQARAAAQTASLAAREAQHRAEAARTRLAAESQALAEVLGVRDRERWPPMVDRLDVPAGLEAALGAVLGEELAAAADPAAPRHWRELAPLPPPCHGDRQAGRHGDDAPGRHGDGAPGRHGDGDTGGCRGGDPALAELVKAPPALARALSMVFLVADAAAGDARQPDLAPGETLVSREGGVWRWDGYTIRAGTPTAAAVRLQQRNRLADRQRALAEAETVQLAARAARAEHEAAERAATAAEQQARTRRRDAEQAVERARATLAALHAQAATAQARLAGIEAQRAAQGPECAEAEQALAQARQAQAELPDLAGLRAALQRTRATLAAARTRESAARAAGEALTREASARAARRRAIAAEAADWRERAADATARVTDLTARNRAAEAELAALEAAPAALAARTSSARDEGRALEAAHRAATAALAEADRQTSGAEAAARAAEAAQSAAREAVVRAEGAAAQAEQAWGVVAERVLERLGASPDLPTPPELSEEAEQKARRRLERLQREREEMGPVNLRAELEAGELATRIAAIAAEREELATAIAKLRGTIGHLNREARERLTAAFQHIDGHFQALFAIVFGGGRAHLALVGDADPLLAGLEIYAQPPGKKLAALSLLSGGEQALTALALIFAVFRCNPAPVCVLDEVDAPLDDANVERFCTLLADMVRETGTRFLVVTHHHVTMARMDRLYGVTMQERGISRLLSVDLQQAAQMVDPLRMAAE
jgi:chromosome segregation protein